MIVDDKSNHKTSDQIPTASDVNIRSVKRKRRPAGTPDPDAEVVPLSPRTLLESDRYMCEICGQGFQREQNLQMHRRRHKVPWKLLKREDNGGGPTRKRVYVCPEETCLHHQAAHALGDLVGIKKHFRRKHSGLRQWICAKCSKAYAVHSDFKAHLKTCGTRGHSCDCGRVFSRVESFIEHQDACSHTGPALPAVCLSAPAQPNNNGGTVLMETGTLLTRTRPFAEEVAGGGGNHSLTGLRLSIGPSSDLNTKKTEVTTIELPLTPPSQSCVLVQVAGAEGERDLGVMVRQAELEKAYAEEARREAKGEMEMAEREFSNARRIRQHARAELDKAYSLKDHAADRIRAALLQITCHACRSNVQSPHPQRDQYHSPCRPLPNTSHSQRST